MDREELIQKMKLTDPFVYPDGKSLLKKTIRKSVENAWDGTGEVNLTIVIEEMAELTKEISKFIRGKGDKLALTEECADVLFSLEYVKAICGLDDTEIAKAFQVKLDRLIDLNTKREGIDGNKESNIGMRFQEG